MQVVSINEPNSREDEEAKIAVGIDFGTTNSLIAISRKGKVEVIPNREEKYLTPSVISLVTEPRVKLSSIKRLFGKSRAELVAGNDLLEPIKKLLDESSATPKLNIGGNLLTLPQIASEIFLSLKEQAEKYLKAEVKKAVVTVPAYFDDAAKGAVLLAARLAGFEVMRLIAEPTAAAYAYGVNKKAVGSYLIYDLGGGTFDVSILNMRQGVLQVIATGGDNMLGGDDIDRLLAGNISQEYGFDLTGELIGCVRQLKEELSGKDRVGLEYLGKTIEFDRGKLNSVISPLIDRTVSIVKETLNQAESPHLEGIVLVGGSTRIPLITEKLKKALPVPVLSDIDPDCCVAMGAAMQAENLVSPAKGNLLIDIISLSLGLEMYGGFVEKIVARGTPLPISVTKEYITYADNQTGMKFHIVQGEREMASDCRSLANFELKGLEPKKAGAVRVEVTFSLDSDGILSVSASDSSSSRSHTIEIKPSYGLRVEEIDLLLKSAYENVAQDHELRLLAESRMEAKSLLYNLEKAIRETPDILPLKKMQLINQAMDRLKTVLKGDNRSDIIQEAESLEKLSAELVTARLNKVIASKLTGKRVGEI